MPSLTPDAAALLSAIGKRLVCDRHWIDESQTRRGAIRELHAGGIIKLTAVGLDRLVLEPAPPLKKTA